MISDNPNAASFPLAALWGQNPEDNDSVSYDFPTAAARQAFTEGVEMANTWDEAEFLNHAHFKVNEEGVAEETSPATAPKADTELFVLWGEDLQPGVTPTRVAYATAEEVAAFEKGVNASLGWFGYHLAPSAGYRFFNEEDALLDHFDTSDWLLPVGHDRLKALYDADELIFPLLANAKGDWVSGDWGPETLNPGPSSPARSRAPGR